MSKTTHEYFDLLITMRSDRRGAEALSSLDIIDTKAGGIAGLIGGFSAAAFFVIQFSIERHVSSILFYAMSIGSVVLLSLSGLLCASSLYIINHFQSFLFSDLDGKTEQEKIEIAAERIVMVYQKRVTRYLWSLYLMFAGVGCLITSVLVYFLLPR